MNPDLPLGQLVRWQAITRYWQAVDRLLGAFDRVEKLQVELGWGQRGTWEQPGDPPTWSPEQQRALADIAQGAQRVHDTYADWLGYLHRNARDPQQDPQQPVVADGGD